MGEEGGHRQAGKAFYKIGGFGKLTLFFYTQDLLHIFTYRFSFQRKWAE
jgi:hypothetical protein